jgi:hypothetical protein
LEGGGGRPGIEVGGLLLLWLLLLLLLLMVIGNGIDGNACGIKSGSLEGAVDNVGTVLMIPSWGRGMVVGIVCGINVEGEG